MIRRSVIFTNTLNQQLDLLAKAEDKRFSEVVRDLLSKALKVEEETRRERMYRAIDSLDGIGDSGITDASTTIDETLYGEQGAWKGEYE